MKTTCTAFIFHEDKLLFVFHNKKKCFMHVGGHMEEGETFSECLLREIKEETNLDVEILDMGVSSVQMGGELRREPVPFFIHSLRKEDGKEKISLDYIAIAKDISKFKLQESELSDYKWVSEEELPLVESVPLVIKLATEAFMIYKSRE
jgi:ADP-ribose pyrophosphatase YjhB (NUDIX family)